MDASSTTKLVYYELPQKDAPMFHCCFRFKAVFLIFVMILAFPFLFPERKEPLDDWYSVDENSPSCETPIEHSEIDIPFMMKEFQECIHPIIAKWDNDSATMSEKWHDTEPCDSMFYQLDLMPMKIEKEKRWIVLPGCKEENVVVTLGIGERIVFEEQLREIIPNTKFYGADSQIKGNDKLFSKIGKFYPFRIGKNQEMSSLGVGKEVVKAKKSATVPLDFFLGDILGLKKIDLIFADLNGSEFDFFSQLHRGAELDQKGVTICQLVVRVHSGGVENGSYLYYDFIHRLLAEKKYAFLKPRYISLQVHTMLILNVEDEDCRRKYVS